MSDLLVFTDGGAFDKGNEQFRAVSSYRVYTTEKEYVHNDAFITETGTSPFAEIAAIAAALKNVVAYIENLEDKEIIIKLYTDSMICHQSLTKWIFSWMRKARNGVFYTSSGTPVANQEKIKEAFEYLKEIRKHATITLYHVNSHTAKKNLKKLKADFEKFNKIKITDDELLFIYLQNARCDKDIQEKHDEFIEKKKPKNISLVEKLKEEI
jgi:ribonuclease HI